MIRKLLLMLLTLILYGCAEEGSLSTPKAEGSVTNFDENTHGTYASTYVPLTSENIVIRNATVFDGNGNKFQNYDVHFSNGEIQNIGSNLLVEGAVEIDGVIYKKGDLFVIHPEFVVDPNFLEDCSIMCVKTPSIVGDKYVVKR